MTPATTTNPQNSSRGSMFRTRAAGGRIRRATRMASGPTGPDEATDSPGRSKEGIGLEE